MKAKKLFYTTMAKRKQISKKLRFEVLKRDSFTCQYCGAAAPDVVLHIDHIKPVAKNGKTDILNLVTSCKDCNFGKGKTELKDNTVLNKQKAQLDDLNEKRVQLELMIKWRNEMYDIEDKKQEVARDAWTQLTGHTYKDDGKRMIRPLIKKYGLPSVLDAMETSVDTYLKQDESGDIDIDSLDKAVTKIRGICYIKSLSVKDREEYKLLGIIRYRLGKRFPYFHIGIATNIIKKYFSIGGGYDAIEDITNNVESWEEWQNEVRTLTDG